jgi:hypothetical protein
LIAQYVNWDLVLHFIEVLIWPTITLMGLLMVRPGRIVSALMDGGEISAGPATFKFRQRLEGIAASVSASTDDADVAGQEPPTRKPSTDMDPYTTVMNGWGLVTDALEEAAMLSGLPAHRRSKPLETVEALLLAKLIDRKHVRSIEQLHEYRNSVKTAGSARAERRGGLTQDVADEYYDNADRTKRSIAITVKRRLAAPTITQPGNSVEGAPLN